MRRGISEVAAGPHRLYRRNKIGLREKAFNPINVVPIAVAISDARLFRAVKSSVILAGSRSLRDDRSLLACAQHNSYDIIEADIDFTDSLYFIFES